jgi:5-methyltetrahydropteroyltriglutamate--homocysteine methyltransferase
MADRKTPPFHAEHIGSLQRPAELAQGARDFRDGKIDDAEFISLQDQAIRDAVAFQEGLGLGAVTDGEFRRRGWSAGFIDAVEGFGLRDGTLGFQNESGGLGIAQSPYAKEPIRRASPIVANDFRFLKDIATAVPKVTIPSPPVMHFFLGPLAVDAGVYPDMEGYFADLTAIYRAEIAELGDAGCTYLQFDETALPCNCDPAVRADVSARGEDPDQLTARYAALVNEALSGRPDDMTVGMHFCRGNLKGAWMAEGGYEPIAEMFFNEVNVDAFFMEYDTPRAGDFEPLRFVPADKSVILGLVSTKTPELESPDDLKRRIDEAAIHVPLGRLGLSPQCGFASAPGSGQPITHDDERRKLELILKVADDVWG